MGVSYPYLAILSFIVFIGVVTTILFVYIYIIDQINRTPVLGVVAEAYIDPLTNKTIMSILIRHERGRIVEVQKIELFNETSTIVIDNFENATVLGCTGRLLTPGGLCNITIVLDATFEEYKLYHGVVYFSEGAYPISITPIRKPRIIMAYPAMFKLPPYNYTCIALTKISSAALTYSDFESYPDLEWSNILGGLQSGVWDLIENGHKGRAVVGIDNDIGIGRSSIYYWINNVSSHSSLWISVKARRINGTDSVWRGIALIDSNMVRKYEVSIYNGTLEIWSFVDVWLRHGSIILNSYGNYNGTAWYNILVHYTVTGTSITINAYVIDLNGVLLNSISVTVTGARFFAPAYIGITIDYTGTGRSPGIVFDDFIISMRDPRLISLNDVEHEMIVEVWDIYGNLVNKTLAVSNSVDLEVVTDNVLGNGSNGRIDFRYPIGLECLVHIQPINSTILGGDAYSLVKKPLLINISPRLTSANITLNLPQNQGDIAKVIIISIVSSTPLYARLVLEPDLSSPSSSLYLNISLMGINVSNPINYSGGIYQTTSTSKVLLKANEDNYVMVSGYFTTSGDSATLVLDLLLEIEDDIIVCYPITITLYS